MPAEPIRVDGNEFEGSEELALLHNMPLGLAIFDAAGALAYANPHFSRLVSSTALPSSPDGRDHWPRVAHDGGALDEAQFPCARALRGEIVSPGTDLVHRGDDAVERLLNVSASPIRDPACGDAIVGIVLLYLDTPDQLHAAAFAGRAGRFWQFAEHNSMAIWIADPATQAFTYRNPCHLALIAAPDAAIATLADWLHHVDERERVSVRCAYDRVLGGATEHRRYLLNGSSAHPTRHVRETTFPIRDDAGDVVMICGTIEPVAAACARPVYMIGAAAASLQLPKPPRGTSGPKVKRFGSIGEFLEAARFLAAGCVVIDIAATTDADENLERALLEHGGTLPMIVIGEADTPASTAVASMRAGAADYLIAPVSADIVTQALRRALARAPEPIVDAGHAGHSAERLARLSRREREVLDGLQGGGTNKSIARDLGISPRTVELHRAHLMERMNVRSLAELVHAARASVG